jgi:hypothetical protein
LLRGRAAFTEGERCVGGLLGCGALVVVGFFGASTIGLAAIRVYLLVYAREGGAASRGIHIRYS